MINAGGISASISFVVWYDLVIKNKHTFQGGTHNEI